MVVIALGVVFGAWYLQQQANLPDIQWLFLGLLVFPITFLFRKTFLRRFIFKKIILLFCAVLFGFSWAALLAHYRLSDRLPNIWEQKDVKIVGVVASIPELTEHGERFVFDVEKILTPQAQVPSSISLNYYSKKMFDKSQSSAVGRFHAGQRWQLTVRLKQPHTTYNPNGFDFEALALSENIRASGSIRKKSTNQEINSFVWTPKYMIAYTREYIGQHIQQALQGKRYAGVILGLVIGDDSQIKRLDWDVYLRTGTNHLMSISGLHITMLSGLVFAVVNILWRRFPNLVMRLATHKAASIAGALTALLYAALAGFSVPTQRTLYMLMTVATMLLIGRRLSFPNILSVALLIVVLIDPWSVMAPGFWLSFGAVAVMVYVGSGRLATEHWLREATKAQWAVTVGLLPALVLMFGQFSLISPIANAIAIPIVSFIVVPFAILGSILPIDAILLFAHFVLDLCMLVLKWLADLPLATWQQATPSFSTTLLAFIGVFWMLLPKGVPLRYFGVFCFLPMLFTSSERIDKGSMQVIVLDVGQGLSVVVKTAEHTLLYDAGAKYNEQSDAGNRIVSPYLLMAGIKHLDGIVVSHDDTDHSGGVPSVLSQVSADWLLSSLDQRSEMFKTSQYLEHRPQKILKCYAGQHWQWDGVEFEILYPELDSYQYDYLKDNDKSCVLKISSLSGNVLLTGDVEKRGEYQMLGSEARLLKSDVLVAPHHGSKTSSSAAFVQAVSPQWVVFTNGYRNHFGHPKQAIVQRYVNQGVQVLRSDYDGAIVFDFKKNQAIKVLKWRKVEKRYWHDQYPE